MIAPDMAPDMIRPVSRSLLGVAKADHRGAHGPCMRVAEAILVPTFLDGSAAIEYTVPDAKPDDAYYIRQVSIARPLDESPFTVERHRGLKTKITDPWPQWRVTRGSGIGKDNGFYGLWLPHIETLLSECALVVLDVNDRVPPTRWVKPRQIRQPGSYEPVKKDR